MKKILVFIIVCFGVTALSASSFLSVTYSDEPAVVTLNSSDYQFVGTACFVPEDGKRYTNNWDVYLNTDNNSYYVKILSTRYTKLTPCRKGDWNYYVDYDNTRWYVHIGR